MNEQCKNILYDYLHSEISLWLSIVGKVLTFVHKLSQTQRLPWRYRWSEDTRDIVFARFLELNKHRTAEERRTGQAAAVAEKVKSKFRRRQKKDRSDHPTLIDIDEGGQP